MADDDQRIENWKPIEIIPLDRVVYCANCNGITRATNAHCPACGSRAVVNLEKLLNDCAQCAVRDCDP